MTTLAIIFLLILILCLDSKVTTLEEDVIKPLVDMVERLDAQGCIKKMPAVGLYAYWASPEEDEAWKHLNDEQDT